MMKALTVTAAASGAAVILVTHARGRLFHPAWVIHLVLPLAAAGAAWAVDRKRGPAAVRDDSGALPAAALLLAMVLYLLSSATADSHFFLSGWAPPDAAGLFRFQGGLARAALATALLTPLCLYCGRRRWLVPLAIMLALQWVTLRELYLATEWLPLYRDDHPSFMYRFWSYARSFPALIYYDPFWNGGKVGSYLVASGIMPMGLLFYPFWRLLPTLSVYTPIIGFSFIVLLPWTAVLSARLAGAGHYRHFAGAPDATISPVMQEAASWLREMTDDGSRVLFAGKTLHGYGAGHVALLPALTGREMMAGDYYAFSPKLVDHEYPPSQWRSRGHKGIREFIDFFNVGYVVTYHDTWKKYLRRRTEYYEEMASFMQKTLEITVFRVRRERPFFFAGRGTVRSGINRIEVRPDSPGEVVLKYRWEEGLSAGGGVELYPVDVGEGVRFIGARFAAPRTVTIRYRGLL
jgi:hypothetical protein